MLEPRLPAELVEKVLDKGGKFYGCFLLVARLLSCNS